MTETFQSRGMILLFSFTRVILLLCVLRKYVTLPKLFKEGLLQKYTRYACKNIGISSLIVWTSAELNDGTHNKMVLALKEQMKRRSSYVNCTPNSTVTVVLSCHYLRFRGERVQIFILNYCVPRPNTLCALPVVYLFICTYIRWTEFRMTSSTLKFTNKSYYTPWIFKQINYLRIMANKYFLFSHCISI